MHLGGTPTSRSCKRAQGQSEEALKNLRRALAHRVRLPVGVQTRWRSFHYDRGRKGQRPRSSISPRVVCRQAQMLDADYAPHLQHLGPDQGLQGVDVISALRFFQRAIGLDPDLFRGTDELWRSPRSRSVGTRMAARRFARAVDLEPSNYDAIIGLGTALRGPSSASRRRRPQYERAQAAGWQAPRGVFSTSAFSTKDYMSGSVQRFEEGQGLLHGVPESGLASKTEFRSSVQDVKQSLRSASRARSGGAPKCRPGRMQNIDISVEGYAGHGLRDESWKKRFRSFISQMLVITALTAVPTMWAAGVAGAGRNGRPENDLRFRR